MCVLIMVSQVESVMSAWCVHITSSLVIHSSFGLSFSPFRFVVPYFHWSMHGIYRGDGVFDPGSKAGDMLRSINGEALSRVVRSIVSYPWKSCDHLFPDEVLDSTAPTIFDLSKQSVL